MDPRVLEATRRERRELGFLYERDDGAGEWRLTGSREGLLKFRDLLVVYSRDRRKEGKSEHSHYGPYMYLEVMTWPVPGFDDHSIHGTLDDLARLASLIDARMATAGPGDRIVIKDEFAAESPYALVLNVREDGFDPPGADPYLST